MAQSLASRSRRPAPGPDTDDVVLARALEFTAWARRNARVLIIVSVIAAVTIGGLIYYRWYQAERAERAAADFMALEQTVSLTGDLETGGADLQRFIDRYDGTAYADEARVMLGRMRLEQGQAAEAVPVLEAAAGRIGRSPVGAQAGLLLGAAYEQAGNSEAAADAYLRVASEARFDFERRQGLQAAAALREAAGNHAAAADLYRQLVELSDEGTFDRSLYEMRRAEAEQRAQQAQ